MKLIKYSIIGLFIVSVVFVAGNSFAQLIPYNSTTSQRFDPFRAGMSPSEINYFTKTYGMGRGTDPSVIPLVEYGEWGPPKATVIVFGKEVSR